MFQCKVCGWIALAAVPPETCPSCGAYADRFRAIDATRLDDAPDDARRIRLLALVEAAIPSPHVQRSGAAYQVAWGDANWFAENIPCQVACPTHTDVASYIALIADGRFAESYELNRESNIFPACLGHVCSHPCEDACRRKYVDAPVGICSLKRFAAERIDTVPIDPITAWNGLRAAVIGAGPAGLAAARELARAGYRVTVFEKEEIAGGLMVSGVPPWRLPRDIVQDEVDLILKLGTDVRFGVTIGVDVTLEQLAAEFNAVIVAVGAQRPRQLDIPGVNLPGVISGLDFLAATNSGNPVTSAGETIAVIGGGFTALDAARTVLRIGPNRVLVIDRRSAAERRFEHDELQDAEAEGVEFRFESRPLAIHKDSEGRVSGITLNRAGNVEELACDRVVLALGQEPDREAFGHSAGNIWYAGDVATGASTFISAIADGKRIAQEIAGQLTGEAPLPVTAQHTPLSTSVNPRPDNWSDATLLRRLIEGDDYLSIGRQPEPQLSIADRGLGSGTISSVVARGLGDAAGFAEASRCLQCQMNIFIDAERCILCNGCVDACPYDCIEMISPQQLASIDGAPTPQGTERYAAAMVIDEESCVRCGKCVDWCPTQCLTMEHFRPHSPAI